MLSCSDFRRDFSEYRDGFLDDVGNATMEAHLDVCDVCSRYVDALDLGLGQLRTLPDIEPSYDFMQRLQHRLYNVDEERLSISRRNGSATSSGFVLTIVLLISAAAWLPLARQKPAVVVLPAISAAAPKSVDALPTLFREGPLLTQPPSLLATDSDRPSTVLFRYSRLGSYASYQIGALPRR